MGKPPSAISIIAWEMNCLAAGCDHAVAGFQEAESWDKHTAYFPHTHTPTPPTPCSKPRPCHPSHDSGGHRTPSYPQDGPGGPLQASEGLGFEVLT